MFCNLDSFGDIGKLNITVHENSLKRKMANKQFNIGKQSLGQGAFGHVYRGTMMHENQEIDVAIKRVTNDGDIFEDIKKECDLLNAVQGHRNIIKLLGLERDENFIYVIMELGDSGDLDHFLMSGEPSLEDKVSIMHGTASAVAYMHNLPDPMIHMDIKPGNIIIMKALGGVVAKVCDFGFARIFKPKFGVQYMSTKTGATSWYRAPELFAYDRKKYDASIDTFALGLVYLVVINFNDEDKSLDPNPTQLRKGALLQYGQHMNLAKQKAEKMPELFTLSADDIWPLVELKSLVTQMTSFHPKDRIKMVDVEVVLRCIEQKTTMACFCNALKGENEDQSNLLVIKNETIANLSEERDNYSKENEALKLQLRKQDEEMQQKDHLVYKSEVKAAQKDKKIQMLEADVASKTMTLHSNTSAITALQRENQENRQILMDKDKQIESNTSSITSLKRENEDLSKERDNNSKENEALKLQLRKQDEEMLQKDHVIKESGVKAAENDQRIHIFQTEVADKTVILQSNTSTITELQMSKDKEVDALQSQLSDIRVILKNKDQKIQNLESQLSNQPKSVDQKSQLSTRPKSVDQKSPLSTRPKSVDQKSPLSTRPKSVDQKSPLSTRPKSVDQKSPLSTRPKSVDQKSPLSTRPKSVDQKSPLSTRPKSVDQKSPLSTRPKSVDQKSPLSIRPKSMDQKSNKSKQNKKAATSVQVRCQEKLTSIKSFRHVKSLVQKPSLFCSFFGKIKEKFVNNIPIKYYCERMCFVNSSIYCTCPDDNSLLIYSVQGKLRKEIKLDTITSPRALHPLSKGRLVLAAETGLFKVDYEGRVVGQIMQGDFQDVHVSGHLIAVIEKNVVKDSSDESEDSDESDESDERGTGADTHKYRFVDRSDRIHILSSTAPYPQSAGFSLGHTGALTVLLSKDVSTVCVSDRDYHHITTYSLSGRQMSQAGGFGCVQPGDLYRPYLCATDSSRKVLICDSGNDRLQLLSAGGEWVVLPGVQVEGPTDAFTRDHYMYVLHGTYNDSKISVLKNLNIDV